MTAELLDLPYPTAPPRDLPPDIQRMWRCNFCATGHHGSCPGAVRNARRGRLVRCYCCERPPYCLDCRATEDVDPAEWICRDLLGCQARVRARLEDSPLHRQLQECRTESAERSRRMRITAEAIRAGLDPDEIDEFDRPQEKKPRVPRPAVGACECCGEATKGGRFLPGHDARLKSKLRKEAKDGSVEARAELERRGW